MANQATEPGTNSMLPTRQSLLTRLRDWQDHTGWREFFDTYWRLIYNVARKAGLADAEAQDVVQTTFIYLARRMPNFRYDHERGSFKSWLRVVTRSRIHEYRRKQRTAGDFLTNSLTESLNGQGSDMMESLADPADDPLDATWQREWEENLIAAAFRRLRVRVNSQHLMIYRLAMKGELPLSQVARKLGVSMAQVYVARHRVGRLFKAEVLRLRRETE